MTLKDRIEDFSGRNLSSADRPEALKAFNELKFFLNDGDLRAAQPSNASGNHGGWILHEWIKKGILLGFRLGELSDVSINREFHFFDKNTYPLKKLTSHDEVRLVPGGSSVRDGAYLAKGVVIMPPAYVNVGAYVDEGTLIDSNALVGSCAQIGKRVHLSAGSQVGGVLEPIGSMPVVIEDDVFVGGNCGVYEGSMVKRRAVLAAGVMLTGSVPVYDLVQEKVYRGSKNSPLIIPENAVVVPGSRHIEGAFAKQHHIAVYAPVIIKYRDANTDAATALEETLR